MSVTDVPPLDSILNSGNNSLGQRMVIGSATSVTPVQNLEVPGATGTGASFGSRWVGTSGNTEIASNVGKPGSAGTFAGTGPAYIQFVERQLDTDATNGRRGTRMDFHTWNNATATDNFVMCIAANGNIGIGPSDLSGLVTEPYARLVITSVSGTTVRAAAAAGSPAFSIGSSGNLEFDSPGVAGGRMKLDGSGFLGLGLSPATPTQRIDMSGNLRLRTIGNKIMIAEGTNASMGVAVLVGGTVTVANTLVTATSRIFLTHQNNSGTVGFVTISARVAATSFTITSSSVIDTSTIAWYIIEPAP